MSIATDYAEAVLPQQEEHHAKWIEKARQVARTIAKDRGSVTSDDVWEKCPPPPGVDSRVMGAIFHPRQGWKMIGYRKSARRVNHGRPIAVWTINAA